MNTALVEARTGHEHVSGVRARLALHVSARARADQELDVELLESVGDDRRVIDDDHVVPDPQRARDGEADVATAADDDLHLGGVVPCPLLVGIPAEETLLGLAVADQDQLAALGERHRHVDLRCRLLAGADGEHVAAGLLS